jgi:hypothetical protein
MQIPRHSPYITLPIQMPEYAMVTYDAETGAVLAITLPDGRVRREDLKTVWTGIEQFNRDCGVVD